MTSVLERHPLPWRPGTSVRQTVHDANPNGDGGKPGRSLGRFDDPEVAALVCAAVNREGAKDLAATVLDLVRRGFEVRFRPGNRYGVVLDVYLLSTSPAGEAVTAMMPAAHADLDEDGVAPDRVLTDLLDLLAGR